VPLAASRRETVRPGGACRRDAPARHYRVAAINVEITLNRYLDYDPRGRMYVLEEDIGRVRREEAQNRAARAGVGEPAVSLGLAGDAIQPLTLRVRPGECLRISLRNDLRNGEAVSLHLHGSQLRVAGGGAATGANPGATAASGATVVYEWMVAEDEAEGTHYFHSHAQAREQTGHGLFGAVIVEPEGSTWLDPRTGTGRATGWDAMVARPGGSFREFVVYYHEVGAESYQVTRRDGSFAPLVDPFTTAYRPNGRALNYRSEPFFNRLKVEQDVTGEADASLAYSSYAFGDPATPMLRSYLGDPVRQRIVHAGPEVFHVHHVHGGGVRWLRHAGPGAAVDKLLDKRPSLLPATFERTDSQSVGPSESFDLAGECASGGCQQSVGDFMFHCHVTHHYFSGMWGIWRVYNTLQDGPSSTDTLPPLAELPHRPGAVQAAVPSPDLVGRTVDRAGLLSTLLADELAAWVERQLPPPGRAGAEDASVHDWAREGLMYLGEPETPHEWPAYRAREPGARRPLLFDPRTGKLAYPFLQPHLGRRPPFAPNHGPAPFLDPVHPGAAPAPPGGSGPASVCPAGTRITSFSLVAVSLPVPLNPRSRLIDPGGQLFVLREESDAARSSDALRQPLVVRANAGEDCVDVTLRNELAGGDGGPAAKVSAHVHFMQFDVQGSDGVTAGFNYEQAVRPYRTAGETLLDPAPAGASTIRLAAASSLHPGAVVGVGMERGPEFEVATVKAVDGAEVALAAPLVHSHEAGETVSTEFVRYRWYPDVQFGTAFFHDHVNVIDSGRHGLYGAIVSEPPGSSYHHPHSGTEVRSGPLADIHTSHRVSADITGSFREFVALIHDDNPLSAHGRSTGSALNLRVEPLDRRAGDPSRRFSSADHGDPATVLPEAFIGDPIVVRTLVAASNEIHSFHLDGHWFRPEPHNSRSPPANTVDIGISERFDLSVPKAGGPQAMAGDYLYYNGRTFKLREGSWGILRVHEPTHTGLRPLPGREPRPSAASVCPAGAPRKDFAVSAVEVPLPMLASGRGKVFVLDQDRDAVVSGRMAPDPLTLHVNVGDCVVVRLTNETTGGPVSFHADLLAFDPRTDGGVAAGFNESQAVAPGSTRQYTYFASPEVGEVAALVRDWGDVLTNPGLGLYGVIVVGPEGAEYRDPVTGVDAGPASRWHVEVHPPGGSTYRDVSLFLQDEDPGIGTHRMPYADAVTGTVGLNYRSAPATPVIEAVVGERVRIHVLAPWSEQHHVFGVEGHRWGPGPGAASPRPVSAVQVGGLGVRTFEIEAGGGGAGGLAGEFAYGDHRGPYWEAGLWGVMRVRSCGQVGGVRPLRSCPAPSGEPATSLPAIVGAAVLATGLAVRRRRGRGRDRDRARLVPA
jgi:FtsP/CotA-like multicopper oxidase with cupredoxin domain